MKNFPLFKVKVDTRDVLIRLEEVLNSGYLNEGKEVTQFKEKLSEIFNHKKVVLTNSCTSALVMALKLSNVQEGDEVITTSMTCVATNAPIKFMGAKVVWADINHLTGNIDPQQVKRLITPKTKAVVCVHWAGNPCDIEELEKICKENNIKLIQDAAHAFGSTYKNKHVCHFGDYTCYSFQAIKHITSGDGGALVCNNENDYKRASAMKWFGIDRDSAKDEKGEWKGQRWEIDVIEAGNKFHMNNITAAIGLSNLQCYDEVISTHKKNAALFDLELKKSSLVFPLKKENNAESSSWVYTIILDEKIDRDKILQLMNEKNVNAGLVHVPNHYYTCFNDSFVELPETEKFSKQQISLPCGWWLDENDVKYIANLFLQLVEKNEL